MLSANLLEDSGTNAEFFGDLADGFVEVNLEYVVVNVSTGRAFL